MTKGQMDEMLEKMMRYREQHFGVEISHEGLPVYPESVRVGITANGFQWSELSFFTHEEFFKFVDEVNEFAQGIIQDGKSKTNIS